MIYPDYVIKNAQVITVDRNNSIKDALAVYGDKIVYVGDNDGAERCIGRKTRVIDAQGNSVLPGFIDAHMHLAHLGQDLKWIDCSSRVARTIDDIKRLIREGAAGYPKGSVIRAFHYDQTSLEGGRHPTRYDLDEAAPDHIVILTHLSYHMGTFNTRALERAGVDASTPDPVGGVYARENGVLTGFAMENAFFRTAGQFPVTYEEMREGLLLADAHLSKLGVTSIHDAGNGALFLRVLSNLKAASQINTRVYAMILSPEDNMEFIDKFSGIGFHTGIGDASFKMGPVKLLLDGAMKGETAALLESYSHNENSFGMLSFDQDTVNEKILKAHLDDYQVTAHALGDRAIVQLLDAYENAFGVKAAKDSRFRIEHCAVVNDDILERIKSMSLIPVIQPVFMFELGDTYNKFIGGRVDKTKCAKSFAERGITACFSTDCPVCGPDPFVNLYAACVRKTATGAPIGRSQIVSIYDAIRMYTLNCAYAAFEDDIKGSLEPGKLADLIIVSKPLGGLDPEELRSVRTVFTMIGGKPVWDAC
ncbi:MAG: amidohydrolase [Clostridiales Family XIII bacterium]|jgi:predicted amidohydrolase YtcJ|nr:amidohydrolase [Clostridiales Family XIII bacterium]